MYQDSLRILQMIRSPKPQSELRKGQSQHDISQTPQRRKHTQLPLDDFKRSKSNINTETNTDLTTILQSKNRNTSSFDKLVKEVIN
jgi:gamma-glutamyl-gamma-aminobutyrate hydrolase PuuD